MPNPTTLHISALRTALAGHVLQAHDEGYDEARQVWNAMIDRRPALIVQCSGTDDVVHALGFARQHGLEVSVRGGGHHIAGHSIADGALMIDLSRLRTVEVSPTQRRAWVQPGATLADLDAATQRHGLATPVGINSTTGIAGLTLGGGFGWLTRQCGMTVDNLMSAEVVTADGKRLHCSADENADLFWGLRGGGGALLGSVLGGLDSRWEKRSPPLEVRRVGYPIQRRSRSAGRSHCRLTIAAGCLLKPRGALGQVPDLPAEVLHFSQDLLALFPGRPFAPAEEILPVLL